MSLIDRVFCSIDFDKKNPLATCSSLPRNPTDHTLNLWESGEGQAIPKPKYRFEKWWLQNADFKSLVTEFWDKPINGDNSIDRWQGKIGAFGKLVKRWSINVEATDRKRKAHYEV